MSKKVIIETPGSRKKFAFDPDEHIFELKKVLPAGMTFPYDFGFVPSTKADDGDPIDVLVLMSLPKETAQIFEVENSATISMNYLAYQRT
jgi:inorganic pyrophosphatase